ncbi:MAG: RNA methyltransferase [Thermodesulfovibrionales bacterium]
MDDWKNNVYFILVEPEEQGNIGASARAIKNMGFRNLCLVKPPDTMSEEGRWFARNAHDVLDAAPVYDSVKEAIQDKVMVVGTSRKMGRRRGVSLPAEKGAARIREVSAENKVAVLFGREASGLCNDEIDECGFMITIPSSEIQPSLNLSQAVLIVAYELSKHGQEMEGRYGAARKKRFDNSALIEDLTTREEIGALYKRISMVLELLDYVPRDDNNLMKNIIVNLKHFIGRAGLTEWELNMLLGLCTQIEKKVVGR